jgi:hypothetical protein
MQDVHVDVYQYGMLTERDCVFECMLYDVLQQAAFLCALVTGCSTRCDQVITMAGACSGCHQHQYVCMNSSMACVQPAGGCLSWLPRYTAAQGRICSANESAMGS